MAKAAEAFRTISEVAEALDIPKHVLRFWEGKFTHIRPMKRGGGRRYYRPEDLELLKGIKQLLHGQGFTIRGVQKILREQGVEQVKLLADAKEATVVAAGEAAEAGRATPKGRRGRRMEAAVPASAPLSPVHRAQLEAVVRELEAIQAVLRGATGEMAENLSSRAASA